MNETEDKKRKPCPCRPIHKGHFEPPMRITNCAPPWIKCCHPCPEICCQCCPYDPEPCCLCSHFCCPKPRRRKKHECEDRKCED